jgi:hypothetical protein
VLDDLRAAQLRKMGWRSRLLPLDSRQSDLPPSKPGSLREVGTDAADVSEGAALALGGHWEADVPPISQLWESIESRLWDSALERYWGFVKPANLALEREMDTLSVSEVQGLDAAGWLDFLLNRYFKWKYTAPNRYATTTAALRRQVERTGLASLLEIRDRIFRASDGPVSAALATVCEIGGLGPAGGSGLLSLLFPTSFGTVDQFVVKALCEVPSLPERSRVQRMQPEGLTIADGEVLTQIMRDKARSLNAALHSDRWTPRRIDMVLWTYGR